MGRPNNSVTGDHLIKNICSGPQPQLSTWAGDTQMRGGEVNVSRGHHRRHVMCPDCPLARTEVSGVELETNLRKVKSFTIPEKGLLGHQGKDHTRDRGL